MSGQDLQVTDAKHAAMQGYKSSVCMPTRRPGHASAGSPRTAGAQCVLFFSARLFSIALVCPPENPA